MHDVNSLTSSPSVAVNTILTHEDKILLGLRHSDPPAWTVPGGHMNLNESIEECARREVREETGLEIDKLCIRAVINDINHDDHTHYINFFVTAKLLGGQLRNGEPEDISLWEWHSVNNLPTTLFYNVKHLLQKVSLDKLLSSKQVSVYDNKT